MAGNVVEKYLQDLGEVYRTGGGQKEESYYGALANLINEVGKNLKPRVRCVGQLKNLGAGEPDFGFFTADQFRRTKDERPIEGQLPERGVIECKGWKDDSFAQSKSVQISKYWKRYGLVLVTNFRDFVLVGRDDAGKPVRLESHRMAQSEGEFVGMLAHPRKTAQERGERLVEFLRRAMLHAASLTEPEDLAWFLASYAREARARVEQSANLPALEGLKNALEEALGMKFEGEKGEHFFQATLVQTLFYGVFSSWVLWSRENWGQPEAKFDWHNTAWTLHVPMIASLFDQISTPKRLKPLGVDEVLDWAGMVLNRVDRVSFFSKFEEEHAVQYFYEPFLKAYDAQLRKDLGVWYTPPEIVQYQVERVDRVLREELEIPDGLADERVVVLDPCCGTGAYLVEVLKRIHKSLNEKGASALTAQKLKQAARERVFGFEILPAPFVVSHLQIGLMLRALGAPLNAEGSERAGVYLTNALTGWEPLDDPKSLLPFPELLEEREAASKVKQDVPILVIIGNPPYNAFSGTSPEEEGGLVDVYKGAYNVAISLKREKEKVVTKYRLSEPIEAGGWGMKKYNLDDLYIRFFRIAERRIAKSGKGIVSYISNFSYLSDPSFVVMRERLLSEFDKIWIDCMNGDSRETGKLTPDGKTDPSVFSTEESPVGIRVGTGICVMVRKEVREKKATVRFQHYWGATKRQDLLASLKVKGPERRYEVARAGRENRYSFRPSKVADEYYKWASVTDLCSQKPFVGVEECRGGVLIDVDKDVLVERLKTYYDKNLNWDCVKERQPSLGNGLSDETLGKQREVILKKGPYEEGNLCKILLRPFDKRWCYHSTVKPLWNRARSDFRKQCWQGNAFLISRFNVQASPEGVPFCFSSSIVDKQAISRNPGAIAIRLRQEPSRRRRGDETSNMFGACIANLSELSWGYLAALGIKKADIDEDESGLIWMHSLAIGYSPTYLEENADGVRQDWPRIPLPGTKKALLKSAELGRRVAGLLDTEKAVDGVTTGKVKAVLKDLGSITKVGGGVLDPNKGELEVTAGWGHGGKGGVCMPGKGRLEVRRQKNERVRKAFGEETLDVYLNDAAYWANVPKCVWEYYIGGYQVVKKWLSYREKVMVGRGLKVEEAEYVTEMVKRIAALVLLQGELDSNYRSVRDNTWAWPSGE
ncbi:MAG: N-6 DNA methylase [Sedimentisphaerales bacterium]|nr:N-6 DNA methylase [Sedimentisphaerales bacterium]